jgi:hypothetical protein
MRCPGCCSCDVMESSTVLFRKRVIFVFRDIIFVLNILYHDIWLSVSTLCQCVWNKWSWAHMRWVLGFACKIRYDTLSFYSCTCWIATISALNLAISPCYTNLLHRRWRWIGILRWGVLGLRCPGCYSYGVLEPSTVLLCESHLSP